jgi:hypothetical protein
MSPGISRVFCLLSTSRVSAQVARNGVDGSGTAPAAGVVLIFKEQLPVAGAIPLVRRTS